MFNIQKQISRLYLSSVLGNLSLTGAWVAILSARGYSLVEIGFALFIGHQAAYDTDILMGTRFCFIFYGNGRNTGSKNNTQMYENAISKYFCDCCVTGTLRSVR